MVDGSKTRNGPIDGSKMTLENKVHIHSVLYFESGNQISGRYLIRKVLKHIIMIHYV